MSGKFIAGTHGNRIMISDDGLSWEGSVGNTASSSLIWVSDLNLFIVGGNISSSDGLSRISTTSDGLTWTPHSSGFASIVNTLAYSPRIHKIMAAGGTIDTPVMVSVSGDASEWVTFPTPFSGDIISLVWADALNCFVAIDGDANVGTSGDGSSWTFQPNPFGFTPFFSSLSWSPSLGLLVAAEGPVIWIPEMNLFFSTDNNYISSNAVDWLGVGSGDPPDEVVVTGMVATSPDGITWTRYSTGVDQPITGLGWSPDLHLVVAGCARVSVLGEWATSSDGINWIPHSGAPDQFFSIAWGNPTIVPISPTLSTPTRIRSVSIYKRPTDL